VCFEGCTGLAPARGCCVSTLRRGFCFPSPQHWAPKIVAWCVRHSWCFGTASVPAPVPAWRATKVAGLVRAASRTSVAPHTNGNGSRSESAGSDSQLPSPEEPCQIGYKHPKACRLGPARAPRRKVTGVTSKPIQFGSSANNDTRPKFAKRLSGHAVNDGIAESSYFRYVPTRRLAGAAFFAIDPN
jgi:hypothetical protein